MTMLRWLFSMLTVPAALLRAWLEHLVLKGAHIHVEDAEYLQKNELCGHVEHKPIQSLGKGLWVGFFPGLLLLLFGVPMAAFGGLQLFLFGVMPIRADTGKVSVLFILSVILLYLGICCLCHLFPTYEDALYLHEAWADCEKKALKAITFVPVWILRIGAFAARFCVAPIVFILFIVCLIFLL